MAYPEDSYLKIFCKLSLTKNLNLAKNPKWGYTTEFGYKAICLTMDMFTKNEFKQWCENNNYSMTKYLRNHVKQVAGIL